MLFLVSTFPIFFLMCALKKKDLDSCLDTPGMDNALA